LTDNINNRLLLTLILIDIYRIHSCKD